MRRLFGRALRAVGAASFGVAGGLAVTLLRPPATRVANDEPPRATRPPAPALQLTFASAPNVSPPSPLSLFDAGRTGFEPSAEATQAPRDLDQERAEAERFHLENHAAALRHHADQPRDRGWASTTERKVEADLAAIGERAKFDVVRVDCRTTSCVAVLEWPSYPEALRSYGAALRPNTTVNCGQEILLPPPQNPSARYQASMVYDCESWRAGTVGREP